MRCKPENSPGSSSLLQRASSAKILSASSRLLVRAAILTTLILLVLFTVHYPSLLSLSFDLPFLPSPSDSSHSYHSHRVLLTSASASWERHVRVSATPRRRDAVSISVLVTGAAGFVGMHCSLALKRRGDGVVGLDNFNSYYDPSLKRARSEILGKEGILVLDADINDGDLILRLFSLHPFTHVLHLAAQAGVRHAIEDPMSYVHSNVAGLVSVLEAAAKTAGRRPAVVWASSSSVYGLNAATPFSEQHRTDRPASLYAATKKAGEEIAHAYNHIFGLSITGLRFFTVYGSWGRPDMAYFLFTNSILSGVPITLFKNVLRDFTYIDDVVNGCLAAIDTAEPSRAGDGLRRRPPLRIYNLGNTTPVPVTKMVAILEKLLGAKAEKTIVRMPVNGDVPLTHANVSLAERDLGYRPITDLETGLRRFVEWYVTYYKIVVKTAAGSGHNAVTGSSSSSS